MVQSSTFTPYRSTRRAVLRGLGAAALATTLPTSQSQAFELINGTIIGRDNWLFLKWDDPRYAETANILSNVTFLSQTAQILRQAGIETVIALTPAKGRVYREFLPSDLEYTPRGETRYQFTLDALNKGGILTPDLATGMDSLHKTAPTEALYFKADTHWTASGSEFAAQEVARVIDEKLHLPPSARPGMTLGPVTTKVRDRNDLADAIGRPGAYPLQSFHVHPPAGGRGLLDDDTADVAVVGSSYMAPEHNFAPMLSNKLRRPVTLVWKVYDFGPYQTLLVYLKSRAFHQSRPKVIVWNFHEVGIKAGPELVGAWTDHAIARPAFLDEVHKAVA